MPDKTICPSCKKVGLVRSMDGRTDVVISPRGSTPRSHKGERQASDARTIGEIFTWISDWQREAGDADAAR